MRDHHRKPCRWRRRKEARPGEIIEAALEQFVLNGFAATKLENVAKQAGISKGTLYLYFDGKEALFKAVVQQIIIPEVEKAEKIASEFKGTQQELITLLINTWWEVVGKTQLSNIPKLMVSEAAHFPDLAKFYVENVIARARNLIKRCVERGIADGEFKHCDSTSMARLVLAPLVFAVIWEKSLAPFDSETYDVERYIKTHLMVLFDGLLAN